MLGLVVGGLLSGLALGMLGAGGTIIGLPMLLYLGGPQGHAAFGTNAFAVALIALLLLLWRIRAREVSLALGVAFALPGLAGIAIGARAGLLYPADKLVFLLSFLILVVAGWIGYLGLRRPADEATGPALGGGAAPALSAAISARRILRIAPTAFAVGVVSGFFAIGGGFLIVPGLALAAAIDLRASARSSLLPIVAFAGLDAIDYVLAGDVRYAAGAVMIACGIAGGAAGIFAGNRLSLPVTQRVFAVFLAFVAAYMIAQKL